MNRALILITCAFAFFATSAHAEDAQKADNEHGPDQSIAVEMGYQTMSNGAIVYEEIVPTASNEDTPIEEIAPAAGQSAVDANKAPPMQYDPVTQTYRRVTVDKSGNSRHDVINTAR